MHTPIYIYIYIYIYICKIINSHNKEIIRKY